MSQTIGILGGMGPEATIRMFNLIVKLTKAEKDQEHIPVVIFNNPKIPDRTLAIIEEGPSPLPTLIEGAKLLENTGASFIIMPCHTAHYYYKEIIKHISIPFLHLQEETGRYLEQKFGDLKRFGLLATTGTVKTGLFQTILNERGLEVIVPETACQETLMTSIYGKKGIKCGFKKYPRELVQKVIVHLRERDVEAIIAGCTDISLVLNREELHLPVIDPLKIIAEVAIQKSGYKKKNL